jgi:uncharacterized protein YjbJ (UPF0337 family)
MAKFEKTDAYVCSGTARGAAAGIGPAQKSFGSRLISFATTRNPEETRMNRDEIKGKAEKAKGYIKEETGEALNDPEFEAEGRGERAAGKVREGFGKAKRKIGEAVDDLADKIDQ